MAALLIAARADPHLENVESVLYSDSEDDDDNNDDEEGVVKKDRVRKKKGGQSQREVDTQTQTEEGDSQESDLAVDGAGEAGTEEEGGRKIEKDEDRPIQEQCLSAMDLAAGNSRVSEWFWCVEEGILFHISPFNPSAMKKMYLNYSAYQVLDVFILSYIR